MPKEFKITKEVLLEATPEQAFTSQYRDRDPGRAYASRWRQWLSWD
jgi:hypothetical protein